MILLKSVKENKKPTTIFTVVGFVSSENRSSWTLILDEGKDGND
jgi:hypothetical protein